MTSDEAEAGAGAAAKAGRATIRLIRKSKRWGKRMDLIIEEGYVKKTS